MSVRPFRTVQKIALSCRSVCAPASHAASSSKRTRHRSLVQPSHHISSMCCFPHHLSNSRTTGGVPKVPIDKLPMIESLEIPHCSVCMLFRVHLRPLVVTSARHTFLPAWRVYVPVSSKTAHKNFNPPVNSVPQLAREPHPIVWNSLHRNSDVTSVTRGPKAPDLHRFCMLTDARPETV